MARAPSNAKPMCCVNIGFITLLLPLDKGLKLVDLLQNAVECDREFTDHDYEYRVRGEPLRTSLKTVNADQISMPQTAAAPRAPVQRKLLK